jgi:hypothetical protein
MRLIDSYRRSLRTATGLSIIVVVLLVGLLLAVAMGWVRP